MTSTSTAKKNKNSNYSQILLSVSKADMYEDQQFTQHQNHPILYFGNPKIQIAQ